MLLHYVFLEVVILLNEAIQWEGGLEEVVPDDEEVEHQIGTNAVVVLLVDVALIVLARVVLVDVVAEDASLHFVHLIFVLVACGRF